MHQINSQGHNLTRQHGTRAAGPPHTGGVDAMARAIAVDIAAPNIDRVVGARIAVGYGLALRWRAAVPISADVVVKANAHSVIPNAGARPTHGGEDGCWQGEDGESSSNSAELHDYQLYRVQVSLQISR